MKNLTRIAAIAATAAGLAFTAAPVAAQELENEAIELKDIERGNASLDPAKGYIFMHSPERRGVMFIKAPNEQDIAEYEAEWREEFEKAKQRYPRRLASWERRRERAARSGDHRATERPVEPTEENFAISAIETRLKVFVGPQYVFDKGKHDDGEKFFQYLQEVEPGTYTLYGPMVDAGNAVVGQCFCMGTVQFEVKAGEITNLGDMLTMGWAGNDALALTSAMYLPDPDRVASPIDYSTPAGLTGLPIVEAELHAAGKVNNFYLVGVSRMPPMDGVLRYERDTVIDVRAEIAAAEAARLEEERLAREAAEAEARAKAEAERLAAEAAAAEAAAAAEENEDEAEDAAEGN